MFSFGSQVLYLKATIKMYIIHNTIITHQIFKIRNFYLYSMWKKWQCNNNNMMLMFMVNQLGKATARVHTVHFMSADKTNCLAHSGCSLYLLHSNFETKVWDLINMQNKLNHILDRSSHLTGKCRKKFKIFSIRSMAVIIVIHDVFVLFSFTKVEVIWFDTFVSDQSLLLLHVLLLLHINYRPNYWSQTKVWDFGLSER